MNVPGHPHKDVVIQTRIPQNQAA